MACWLPVLHPPAVSNTNPRWQSTCQRGYLQPPVCASSRRGSGVFRIGHSHHCLPRVARFRERRAEQGALPRLTLGPEGQMAAVRVMLEEGEGRKSPLHVLFHLRLGLISFKRVQNIFTGCRFQPTCCAAGNVGPQRPALSQGIPQGPDGGSCPFAPSRLHGRGLPEADRQKVRPFTWSF